MVKSVIPLLIFSVGFAQNSFFTDPVVSGTAIVPDEKLVEQFIFSLQESAPDVFRKYTSVPAQTNQIGDERNFKVLNFKSSTAKTDLKTFVLKMTGNQINIWVEKDELENQHVNDEVINNIYNSLINNTPLTSINPDRGILAIETDFFGSPPDIDGNGKVEFLLTDIQDNWEKDGSYVGGFFYSADQSGSIAGNGADILYVDTYPGIYTESNGQPVHNATRVLGTVAHELQHLIHYAWDRNEEVWVNEGLSELASLVCGYGLRAPDLYLKNSQISLTDWDKDNSLQHYSKAALWTYFLYERFGAEFIKDLVVSKATGVNGFDSALNKYGTTFNAMANHFFKTVVLNNPQLSPEFSFSWHALQYQTIVPFIRTVEYPFLQDMGVQAYSVKSYLFTNGTDFYASFRKSYTGSFYLLKNGFGFPGVLEETSSSELQAVGFGADYHTLNVHFINATSSSNSTEFYINAFTKNKLRNFSYTGNEPDFNITSTNAINGIQYISDSDSSFLKSIEIYTSTDGTEIRIYLFDVPLTNAGRNSIAAVALLPNVISSGWHRFDLEDFTYFRNSGESFDVAVEFTGEASMGYQNPPGSSHQNKSYLMNSSQDRFVLLNQFSTSQGNLDGSWMIRLETASRLTEQDKKSSERLVEIYSISPNPFIPAQNKSIEFEYLTRGEPDLTIQIFNSLGQLVYSEKHAGNNGVFSWNGRTLNGNMVSSGMYFIRMSTSQISKFKKFIIIR